MRSIILAVVCLFGAAMNVRAQEQKGATVQNTDLSWEQVSKIKTQQSIKVYLLNGEELKGAFVESVKSVAFLFLQRCEVLWPSWFE